MITLVVILHVFVCFFLIIVILLQAGRGQGLSWGSFGGTPQSILGTRTASFFARLTTACAIVFLLTCIALNVIETKKSRSLLATSKSVTQVDLAKIKEALSKVEQASKAKPADTKAPAEPQKPPTTASSTSVPQATPSAPAVMPAKK